MRISQAYVSKSIMDFPFHDMYSLDQYCNNSEPSLFIGCYRYEDIVMIANHKGEKLILWTGQDALDYEFNYASVNMSRHFTAHPKIYERFIKHGIDIILIPPSHAMNKVSPQLLGPKIYAYCPGSSENYHGKEMIDALRLGGYDIVIGDGKHTQKEWIYARDGYYNDCHIGLCLSPFAGGAGSVIEMGLRGMPVITNVLNLPNCKPFETVEDVAYLIEQNKVNIGKLNGDLAMDVWDSLDHKNEWLNI